MTDRTFELERKLNQNPLNRLCRDLLEKVGGNPAPTLLHSLVLVEWLLENRPDRVGGRLKGKQTDVLQTVRELMSPHLDPRDVQALLLRNRQGSLHVAMRDEATILKRDLGENPEPEEVALELLDNLSRHLSLSQPLPPEIR